MSSSPTSEFEGLWNLGPSEIDALEDAAYKRVSFASSPEEAAAALADVQLIHRFIGRLARGEENSL